MLCFLWKRTLERSKRSLNSNKGRGKVLMNSTAIDLNVFKEMLEKNMLVLKCDTISELFRMFTLYFDLLSMP